MTRALPGIEITHPKGASLLSAGVVPVQLWTGGKWTEGPLVLPWDGSLIFSDIPNNRILQVAPDGSASVWKHPSNFANGRTLDADGSILTCEHGGRRVTRTRRDGTYTVVVDSFEGRRLNSPNDVVVRPTDGSIWFTDPPYGIESDYEGYKGESEQTGNHVYRYHPDSGAMAIAAGDFDRPNGLAFSADGGRLYIADSGASMGAAYAEPFVAGRPHQIRVFDVAPDGTLSGGDVIVDIDAGVPDGLRLDGAGRIWTSAGDGVRCYGADGTLLLKVLLPEVASNLTIHGRTMYITASTSVWRLELGA